MLKDYVASIACAAKEEARIAKRREEERRGEKEKREKERKFMGFRDPP